MVTTDVISPRVNAFMRVCVSTPKAPAEDRRLQAFILSGKLCNKMCILKYTHTHIYIYSKYVEDLPGNRNMIDFLLPSKLSCCKVTVKVTGSDADINPQIHFSVVFAL